MPAGFRAALAAQGAAEMARVRIIFQKTGWFTFINHLELPVIFSRAARRAGITQEFTQGFSPHPRLSLGPPLAAGVTGLAEAADFWFNGWNDGNMERWNNKLPDGLRILTCREVEGPSLAKLATGALYKLRGHSAVLDEKALEVLEREVRRTGELFLSSLEEGEISLTLGGLEQCGAGNLVRSMAAAGVIGGWRDVRIVRSMVGTYDRAGGRLLPLVCPGSDDR